MKDILKKFIEEILNGDVEIPGTDENYEDGLVSLVNVGLEGMDAEGLVAEAVRNGKLEVDVDWDAAVSAAQEALDELEE